MARRSSLDIFARWFWLVLLPGLVLLPFRAVRWVWRMSIGANTIAPSNSKDFYRSAAWRKLRIRRMEINVRTYGRKTCELCFTTEPGGPWEVHHVKSRSRYPERALDLDNTALLCPDCNQGLSNDYQDLDLNRCRRKYA